jgi:hypothetical protein
MNTTLTFLVLLTLCGCHTTDRSAPLPPGTPVALNEEFRRSHHEAFSASDRELIATARLAIRQSGKLPASKLLAGGSEDAFYRVRHTADGHEVFVIYVIGYDGAEPLLTGCMHNEVLLNHEAEVLKVLGGPECWP